MNAFFLTPTYAEPVGRALALAGHLDEASPYLAQASASCDALDGKQAFFSTWAAFDLGRAFEALGKPADACVA